MLTISAETILGADTPINISFPLIISCKVPLSSYLFVFSAIIACSEFIHCSPTARAPFLSTKTTLPMPNSNKSLHIDIPAEPAPFITTLASSIDLLTNFKALIIPAETTIAVPC